MTEAKVFPGRTRLRVLRVASTGAFATLWLFVLGWIWAALSLPGADAFVGLFTTQLTDQSVGSVAALGIGSLCAFVVGGIFGVLIAHCYNLAGRVLGE
ncbi:hypothetical protein [Brevundimonas mediterranea]|uniref:ABC-type nitrate/sulfonate/bicarbonate transport system permease component n=1 Tax=Brevundimonas mediterranea TaxID=74329 RepID=A0A7W6F0G1_9CAUL|nr:hypothetical protein [Brevundimonas mediterranea]MBB3873056.1 ABC-type nitrate/sulfonate/bicarbonate transport system permease component [Brevundimonas mediterranea]